MKTLVLAGLLAAASASGGNTVKTAASAASAAATPPPYTFLLHFPDGSIEICPTNSFSIGFPEVNVEVQNCAPDKVFGDAFGG